MRIHVMRSQESGCEPTCAEWISLQGNFRDASVGEFRKVLAKLGKRKLPVLVHSTGGRLDPAMAIGKQIRAKGLDVIVAKTLLVRCTAGDAECRRMLTIGVEPGKVEFGPTNLAICAGPARWCWQPAFSATSFLSLLSA